jgi:hypothetical protein
MLKQIIILGIILLANCHNALSWPIPDTGQTKCYDNEKEIPCPQPGEDFYGQDGNYIINPPSYTKLDKKGIPLPDNASSWVMVKDNVTGLIWENKTDDGSIHDKDQKYDWQDAQDIFIKSLNQNSFGGATDWRLPSIKELASITFLGKYSPAIDSNWFSNMSAFYWSSTSYAYNTGYAWGVYFYGGYGNDSAKDSSYFVRAVRGGQCGSFGHLVINHDGTITDQSTGLMWQIETTDKKTWKEALLYCNQLTLADFSDWRLPSREELRSIVDYSTYNPSTFEEFDDTMSAYYWSSTSYASYTGNAWGVYFNYGDDRNRAKGSSYFVRAVRGGQCWLLGHLVIWSPGQGELLDCGNKLSITWDTAGITGNVKISFSTNGGKSFSAIVGQTENDGKYDWIVPEVSSVNCVLKIEPVNAPDKGTSQGLFSIYTPPAILKGHVTDLSTHATIPNAVVSINGQTTQTNTDGYYEIEITSSGSYTISFSKNDYLTKVIENMDLKSGENLLDVEMVQPGSIAGVISDVWAKVIPDVTVTIFDKTVQTDSQGKYLINGLISGNSTITFSHPDYYSVTIDNIEIQSGQCTTLNYNLSKAGLLNMATLYLSDAEVNDDYEERILVNGAAPFTFNLAYGNLPPDLSLNPQTGTISGELKTPGSYTFYIGVSDATDSNAEREFTINVVDRLTISIQALPRGTKNQDYFENILATGGTPPYTFTLKSGTLPTHLQLSKTGKLTGHPTKTGSYQATIQVTDSENRTRENTFTLQIVDLLIIQTNRLNDGIIDTQYNQTLSASGGYGDYIWTVYSGKLLHTLRINNPTQQLIGKPEQPAYKTIVLSVKDADGRIAYKDLILHIVPPLSIPMSMLPNALKNELYSEAIPIQGGIGSFTYACEGLPPDLTIDPTTGIISGKSIIGGYNNVEIQVTDSTWPTNQNIVMKTGIRTTSMLTILTNAVLHRTKQGEQVSIDPLRVSGVSSTYDWSCVKGYLPAGIQLDQTNGRLSGTPIGAGTRLFTLKVKDDQNQTAEKEFVWHITDSLKIITQQVPNAAENIDYNFVLEAAGGIPPYEWRLKTGELPLGLSVNKTGALYGTPKSRQTRSFTIEVNDSDVPAQKTLKTFAIEVLIDDLYIYTPDIPNARINQAYIATIKAMLGKPPYTWHQTGQLPPGLTFQTRSDSVTLEGTPTTPGDYQVTIFVEDSSTPSTAVNKTYDMSIYDSLTIQTTLLKSAQFDDDYSDIIQVSGGIAPYIWRIIEGTLPQGLVLNASTGEISGTISDSNAVSSEFLVQLEDSGMPSQQVDQRLIIYVGNDLRIVTEVIQQARQYDFFSATLQGVGGILPYHWQLNNGELPKCITLNPITGRLFGRPETFGSFDVSIRLSDQSTPMNAVVYSYNFMVDPNDTWIDGDLNLDRMIDLQDVILSLQIMVDMIISVDGWSDMNQDCQLGIQDTLGLMNRIAH